MATWTTPKTDWKIILDSGGNYQGDYFNAADYNRIKNNFLYLHEQMNQYYQPATDIPDLGADKTYTDFCYADEFNALEEELEAIKAQSIDLDGDTQKTFYDNGAFINHVELNRLESAQLKYYEYFNSIGTNSHRTAFRAGKMVIL